MKKLVLFDIILAAFFSFNFITNNGIKNNELRHQTKLGKKMKDNINDIVVKDMEGKETSVVRL